jgi:hypothetical protein
VAGAALTTYAGQFPFTNPVSGNSYLARLAANVNTPGTLLLCDRLWHNSGLSATLTTSQTVNSAAWPARDMDASTNGRGILIGFEVSTVMGAGTPTFTLGYTNSAGTSGLTIVTAAQAATMAVGSFIPFQLSNGDVGVRSIQTFQLNATMTSGAYHLVAYRIIAQITIPAANIGYEMDAIPLGFPRCFDNSVLFPLWLPSTTTAPTIQGQYVIAQG